MSESKPVLKSWYGLFLCLMCLAVSAVAVPFWIAADQGDGTFGTYTAETEECYVTKCDWIGTWVSDDGTMRREKVHSGHSDLHEPGDQVRLQKGVSGDESMYSEDSSKGWIMILLGDIGCLIFVVLFIRGRVRARRAGAAAPPPPLPGSGGEDVPTGEPRAQE